MNIPIEEAMDGKDLLLPSAAHAPALTLIPATEEAPPTEREPSSDDESPNATMGDVVDANADMVDAEVGAPVAVSTVAATPWNNTRTTLWWWTIVSVLLAVVLGLSIGWTIDKSSSSSTDNNSAPTNYTIPPTCPPEFDDPNLAIREIVLKSYMNNITYSDQIITAHGASPESQALLWMIVNDTTLNTSDLVVAIEKADLSTSALGFSIRQRYAVLTMWFQQNETEIWDETDGLLTDVDECNWYGISCETLTDTEGDGEPRNAVTGIRLKFSNRYVGIFPPDMGLLTNLHHLEIRDTSYDLSAPSPVYGTLPDSIGQWTALTYFNVGFNLGLNGTLPGSICQWTALTYFNVNENQLTGSLPDSCDQWTALTHFDVGFNHFTGSLPDIIGQWTALTLFGATDNSLSGTFPDIIGRWSNMTVFLVSDNDFTGTIPMAIGNWSLFFGADFTLNQLVGTMPSAICEYMDDPDKSLRVDCSVNCSCCTFDCVNNTLF